MHIVEAPGNRSVALVVGLIDMGPVEFDGSALKSRSGTPSSLMENVSWVLSVLPVNECIKAVRWK